MSLLFQIRFTRGSSGRGDERSVIGRAAIRKSLAGYFRSDVWYFVLVTSEFDTLLQAIVTKRMTVLHREQRARGTHNFPYCGGMGKFLPWHGYRQGS